MKLNHLNVTVSSVPETHRFLEKHFALKSFGGREPGGRDELPVRRPRHGSGADTGSEGTEVRYPPGFHVGFIQESEDRVNEINQRLREDGYEVPKPARLHGSWRFYFKAPGGFTIEVLC